MSRKNFSRLTKELAYGRSKGICECHRVWQLPTYDKGCGVALGPGNIFYEHINCDAISGDNSFDNCAVLVKTCWKLKTDTYDKPTVAKSNRIRAKHRGTQTESSRPMPCGRKSLYKKKMNGAVVLR